MLGIHWKSVDIIPVVTVDVVYPPPRVAADIRSIVSSSVLAAARHPTASLANVVARPIISHVTVLGRSGRTTGRNSHRGERPFMPTLQLIIPTLLEAKLKFYP